jgi:hypothetical protein
MALFKVRITSRVFVVVKVGEGQLVTLASRQWFIVREKNVEHFHHSLI